MYETGDEIKLHNDKPLNSWWITWKRKLISEGRPCYMDLVISFIS